MSLALRQNLSPGVLEACSCTIDITDIFQENQVTSVLKHFTGRQVDDLQIEAQC